MFAKTAILPFQESREFAPWLYLCAELAKGGRIRMRNWTADFADERVFGDPSLNCWPCIINREL